MRKNLRLAAILLATFVTNTFAQTDGEYYLYDATNKVFLSRGGAYGTEATADKYGVPFTWTSSTGVIYFKDMDSGTGLHIETNGTSVYTDNAKPTKFVFTETTGGYYLQNEGKTSYARHDNGSLGEYVNMTTDATNAIVWTLKTKAERDAIVNAYPTENINNIISKAGWTGKTTADDFKTYLTTNTAMSTTTYAPTTYSWTKVRGGNASSVTPREVYEGTGNFTYSLTGLAKGVYKVAIKALERDGWNAACVTLNAASYNITTSTLTANSEQTRIKAWAEDRASDTNPNSVSEANTLFGKGKYVDSVYTYVDTDGKLDLTVAVPAYRAGHWFIFGNTVLTYYNDAMSTDDANTAIANANTMLAKTMETSATTSLTEALNTFKASETIANYNALSAAMTAAQTSVDAYAKGKAALDAMKDVMDNTNVYTADAYNTYNTTYTTNLEEYTNRSWTAAEANAMENPEVYIPWHTANIVDDLLLSAWGVKDYNGVPYINTWSTEGNTDGSNFKVPFFEYWTGSTSLDAKTMKATMTGLEAGVYKVTGWIRTQNNGTASANGITLKVNDGTAVDVTKGTQVGTSSLYLNNYTAYGTVGTDGKLVITFDVSASSNVSWLSFKNMKYAKVSPVTLDEATDNTITAATDAYVVLNRSFSAGMWNTICLPFALTADEIKSAFGSEAKVAEFNGQTDAALNFTTTTAGISANVPYLISIPSATATSFTFTGKDIVSATSLEKTVTGCDIKFVGNYNLTKVGEGNYFISGNKFYKAGTTAVTLKPFRAYFTTTASSAKQLDINIDGETTSISNIDADVMAPATIYNLNGQKVRTHATSTEGLQKGVYIMNGKSVIVK